jgi:hypothetical protein
MRCWWSDGGGADLFTRNFVSIACTPRVVASPGHRSGVQ